MEDLRNKRATVAGLGHFGGQIAVARWLVDQGAKVLVTDKSPADKLADSLEQLTGLPIEYRLGEHRHEDFTSADLIVASPAISPSNEFLQAAGKAGVPITTEIRLVIERCPAPIVGVTGTKGKSTTTALLGKMLAARSVTHVGGNIGGSLLPVLASIKPTDMVVLELSSFMLEHLGAMRWSPHVAVVSMLASDHLQWHGSQQAYLAAKGNIVRFQNADDIAVVNEEDPPSLELIALTPARIIRYGLNDRRPIELALPGRHNKLNAQAAMAAAMALGVTFDEAQAAVRQWPGLPHRLQRVYESAGVSYIDDSIATIPGAAVVALESFPPGRVVQIIGGFEHGLAIDSMCAALRSRAKAALCIGASGDKVATTLEHVPGGGCAVHRCGELAVAMKIARTIVSPGDVVLLSTGYKSFDQFRDYQQRGNAFAELARAGA